MGITLWAGGTNTRVIASVSCTLDAILAFRPVVQLAGAIEFGRLTPDRSRTSAFADESDDEDEEDEDED
jgi:hypothetical protein